jgi:hypothetical protein
VKRIFKLLTSASLGQHKILIRQCLQLIMAMCLQIKVVRVLESNEAIYIFRLPYAKDDRVCLLLCAPKNPLLRKIREFLGMNNRWTFVRLLM